MMIKNVLTDLPPAIAELPLRTSEKLALHILQQRPDITNDRLAQLLGMRSRGAQNLLRRLRKLGYIGNVGKGRARRIKLMFHTEQHSECEVRAVE